MVFSRDAFMQKLSPSYKESRNIESITNEWRRAVREELSGHLSLIKEGAKGFSQAHDEILSLLIHLESNEKGELVIREILDDILPGARDWISQIGQLANQWPSQVAPEAVMVCEDDNLRSPTMDLELGPSNQHYGESSMGPPPRPTALPTPVTPAVPRDNVEEGAHEPPPGWEEPESNLSDSSLPPLTLLQAAKRSLDFAEMDHPGSPELPAKRAKSSTTKQLFGLVTKSVDFEEIDGKQFIFRDNRYGKGWFAVWCDRDTHPPFLKHPLWNRVAIDHFNSRGHSCHDQDRSYELEDILREYTYRVNDPEGGLTTPLVRRANAKLHLEYGVPKGPARKSRKGKQRAGPARSAASYQRSGSVESGETYQDESWTVGMTNQFIAEFQAED